MQIKKFKQYILENIVTFDGVDFDFGTHFIDRIKERNLLSIEQLESLIKRIREKLAELDPKGEFLFYSRELKQGVIAAWDAFKHHIKFITFLPKGKEFPKPGTEKIYVESHEKKILIIYID